MWTGGGREVVGAEGIGIMVRALALAISARGGGGCGGGGVVFVAFLLDARGEFLQDGELEEGGKVGDAAGGEEEGFEGAGRRRRFGFGRSFIWVRWGGGLGWRGKGKRGGRDIVGDDDVEGGRLVVAESQAEDDGFGAESREFEDVLHGRLRVRVAEGVVRGVGVPFCWEGLRGGGGVGEGFCGVVGG